MLQAARAIEAGTWPDVRLHSCYSAVINAHARGGSVIFMPFSSILLACVSSVFAAMWALARLPSRGSRMVTVCASVVQFVMTIANTLVGDCHAAWKMAGTSQSLCS